MTEFFTCEVYMVSHQPVHNWNEIDSPFDKLPQSLFSDQKRAKRGQNECRCSRQPGETGVMSRGVIIMPLDAASARAAGVDRCFEVRTVTTT